MRKTGGVLIVLWLAVLATAGLHVGPSAARGPERTMSSDLVVDGGRQPGAPVRGRRTQRPGRPKPTGDDPSTSVRVARSEDEVEDLRPEWESLQGEELTSDIDFFLTYVRNAPGMIRPHVVLVERGGSPLALVVGRLEQGRVPARLGYKTVFSPEMRTLTIVYGGMLGAGENGHTGLVLEALRESVVSDELELMRVRGLTPGSMLDVEASGRASRVRRERFARATAHWRSALPGSLDEFLAKRKKKVRWQARKDAQLADTYGDDLEVRVYRDPADLEQLFEDTGRVHRLTYQSALGVGFSEGPLNRALTDFTMRKGWFRGYVLYLRGTPVAFWHGNAYNGTFGLGPTGFDPAYGDDRPGGYLLMRLIGDLCEDAGVHTFDFGFGDATYKRQLGDVCRTERDLVVFAPRLRPFAVNVARNAVHGVTHAGRTVLAGNRVDDLRRRWRSRLALRKLS
jgi:CelD/BcsL family acetyltransferase involved in cellulose biosynthesis